MLRSALKLCGLGFLCAAAALASACKETGTVQVSKITFSGNKAISASRLKTVIATQENTLLAFTKHHYFDRAEFERDEQRLIAFYADQGYPSAKIVGVDVQLNSAKDKVSIKIDVNEGTPVIVESIVFEGLNAIPAAHLEKLKSDIPFQAGQPRSQTLILASHEIALGELRDHGFPYGTVKVVERPGTAPDRVQLAFVADPGPSAVFGPITIDGAKSVSENVVRRELVIHEGDEYRLSQITESQRRLYGLELFSFANITPRLPENRAPVVPVVVSVAEVKLRRLQLAGGYGSEEKVRARVTWRHVNFFGGARIADAEARWSSLEHGFRVGLTEPHLLRPGTSMRITGQSWWASEPTYTYRSTGGRAKITKQLSRGMAGVDRGVRNEISATFINEYERYAVIKSALNDPTLTDDFIALGLNPITGQGNGLLSALEVDYDRDTSGQPLDPHTGYALGLHVESANKFLGGDFRYTELVGEGRKYFQLGSHLVLAGRVKGGTLQASSNAEIPFFKRYFAGGSTSIRGWGRYQISPLTASGQPLGGRSIAEMSTEARFSIRGRLTGVVFIDGGNVWARAGDINPSGLRWAVGPGLRYDTPIGPFRVDLGKQLNPIPGLLIDGLPETRFWRVHFSIGQAF